MWNGYHSMRLCGRNLTSCVHLSTINIRRTVLIILHVKVNFRNIVYRVTIRDGSAQITWFWAVFEPMLNLAKFEFIWAEIYASNKEDLHFFRIKKKKKNYELKIILMTINFKPNRLSSRLQKIGSKLDRHQIYDDYGPSID